MSDTHLADDLSEAERHFFESGGDVNEALVNENKDTPVEPASGGSPSPASPPASTAPSEGAAGAGDDDEDEGDQTEQQQPGQQQQPRRVNYNKFRRAEERATAAERQLQEQNVKNARVEERLNLLMEALNGPAAAAAAQQEDQDPKPDKNVDIFGYADWLERQVDRVTQRLDGFDQMVNTGQSEMTLQNNYFADMNTFAGSEPNFVAAYRHLFLNRDAELAYYHPEMNRQQRNAIIIEEERELYKSAFQAGRSPAQMIFELAKVRGFQPPAAQAQPGQQGQQPQQGQPGQQPRAAGTPLGGVPAAASQQPGNGAVTRQPVAQPQTAAELVQAIKRGQGASLSLSQGAGGTGLELTPQMLGDMTDDEFAAVYGEIEARGKDRMRDFFGS